MIKNIKQFIDFRFQKIDIVAICAILLCCIIVKIFNITVIYENSILENTQLVPLVLGAFICFRAKNHKPLFIIIALFLILFFFRELSYGRVIYGAIPGYPHDFYPLSHFKYGYLTNIIIGLYLAFIFIFAIVKKVWNDIFSVIKEIKFPIWTFLFAVIFVIVQIYGEKIENTVLEEITELAIYCFTFSLCFIYTKFSIKK